MFFKQGVQDASVALARMGTIQNKKTKLKKIAQTKYFECKNIKVINNNNIAEFIKKDILN